MVGSKQPTTVWLSPEEADRVRFLVAWNDIQLIHHEALRGWCLCLEICER